MYTCSFALSLSLALILILSELIRLKYYITY